MEPPDQIRREMSEILSSLRSCIVRLKGSGIHYIRPGDDTRHARGTGPGSGRATRLQAVRDELGECRRCPLCSQRKHIVFGEGNPEAGLVFVGEAPGADEDATGKPFVGRAGQLLGRIIAAIHLTRQDVYIANIIKCRPPGNRNPDDAEIRTCLPFLEKQLEVIQPRIICALGSVAARTLLDRDAGITHLRGRFYRRGPSLVMPTYHPSYLLRNQARKREAWEDMQMVEKEYRTLQGG